MLVKPRSENDYFTKFSTLDIRLNPQLLHRVERSTTSNSKSFPNTSISSCMAIIPTCPHLQFRTIWLFRIDQSSAMFYFCSRRLNFARRKYLGSYLPSYTVLTAPTDMLCGGFFFGYASLAVSLNPATNCSAKDTRYFCASSASGLVLKII